jgi:3-mercaptopyruvate sulfurtransferase SseA
MVAEDGTMRRLMSVEGIDNREEVVVTGELRRSGIGSAIYSYWTSSIETLD